MDSSNNATSPPDNAQSLAAAVSATVMRDLQQMVHQQVEAALAAHSVSQTSAPPRTAATTGTAPPPAATPAVNQEVVLESDSVNLEILPPSLHQPDQAPSHSFLPSPTQRRVGGRMASLLLHVNRDRSTGHFPGRPATGEP